MTEALKTILDYPHSMEFPSCWAEAELRLAAAGIDFTPETVHEMHVLSRTVHMTNVFFENLFIAFVKSGAFTKDFIPNALNWVFNGPIYPDSTYYDEEVDTFGHAFISKHSRSGSWDDIFPVNDNREKRRLAIKSLVMNRSIEISPKTCLMYISDHRFLTHQEPFFCQLLAKRFQELGKHDISELLLTSVSDSAKNEMFLK